MSAPAIATRTEPQAWQVWTALWIVYIVWGSTYLAIRVVVETMPPMLTGGVRFLIAGLLMLVVVLVRRGGVDALRGIDRAQLGWAAFVGSCLAAGGNGLVMVGEQWIESGLAALIIAAVPLWVVLFRRLAGERVSRVTLIGVAFGFVGVGVLLLPGGGAHAEPIGFFFLICASLSWATGSFASSRDRVTLPGDPVLSTALQMSFGGLLGIVIGAAIGEFGEVDFDAFATDSLIAFAYLILIGSLVAYTAYSWLLQNVPVSKVATYAFVNPVIAIFLGWLFLSEDITLTIAAGATVIVLSVAAIVRQETARPEEEAVDVGPA